MIQRSAGPDIETATAVAAQGTCPISERVGRINFTKHENELNYGA